MRTPSNHARIIDVPTGVAMLSLVLAAAATAMAQPTPPTGPDDRWLIAAHAHGASEEGFLAALEQHRAGQSPDLHFEVIQSEAGRTGNEAASAHWRIKASGADFDADLTTVRRELWVAKRGDAFWHFNGTGHYRFWADTWEKGHLCIPGWGRFDSEGLPAAGLASGYDVLQGDVFTTAVFHVLMDRSPGEFLRRAYQLRLAEQQTPVGDENCQTIEMIPQWKTQSDIEASRLGLRPEVRCQFAASDGRLVTLRIIVSVKDADGAPVPWLTTTTRTVSWSGAAGSRAPAVVQVEMRDAIRDQQLSLSNIIVPVAPDPQPLAPIPQDIQLIAADLELRDAAYYQQVLVERPEDLTAQLNWMRCIGISQRNAFDARQELKKLARALPDLPESVPAPLFAQAAELAYSMEADGACLQFADRFTETWNREPYRFGGYWPRRTQIARTWALYKHERNDDVLKELATLLALPEGPAQSDLPSPEEMDWSRTYTLSNWVEPAELRRLEHMRLAIGRWQRLQAAEPVARLYERGYRQWCGLREKYLQGTMTHNYERLPDRNQRFDRARQFVEEGIVAGLRPFEAVNERRMVALQQATDAHADAQRWDDRNRFPFRVYWGYLKNHEPASPTRDAELARVKTILKHPDPIAVEEAAREIKRIFSIDTSPYNWNQTDPLLAEALTHTRTLLGVAEGEANQRKAATAALDLAERAADLCNWPPLNPSPQIEQVFTLRGELPAEADRRTLDALAALVMARTGQLREATLAAAVVRDWIAAHPEELSGNTLPRMAANLERVDSLLAEAQQENDLTLAENVPIPASEYATANQTRQYADAATEHYLTTARKAKGATDVLLVIQRAVESQVKGGNVAASLEVANRCVEVFDDGNSPYAVASARLFKMAALCWNQRIPESLQVAKDIIRDYGSSRLPKYQFIVAEALTHAYKCSHMYLNDPIAGDGFLTALRNLSPRGKFDRFITPELEQLVDDRTRPK